MIMLHADTPILLALQPVDFRLGIDGLVAVCKKRLSQQANNGTVFVFINRRKTMVRALSYDGSGFWLMTILGLTLAESKQISLNASK